MARKSFKSRATHVLFALATLALTLGLVFAVVEVAIRLFVPAEKWIFLEPAADWEVDARLGWTLQGNRDVTAQTNFGWPVRFRTNPDGLTPHDAKQEKPPGVLRVMFVGDSIVLGRYVPQDETVTAQLERLLMERGINAEVINAAVEGYSTDQALLRMEQLVPLYAPDVILLGVCTNDFGGNASSVAYKWFKPRFELDSEGALREIPPQAQDHSARRGWGLKDLIQFSAAYRLVQPSLIGLRAKLGGWSERNLTGLADEFYYRPEELERFDWELFGALIGRMNVSARQGGAEFAVYAHPALPEVWEPYIEQTIRTEGLDPNEYDAAILERRLDQVVTESGARFCPLIETFRTQQERGPFHLLPRDPHCNPVGYAVTAERLADFVAGLLREQPVSDTAGAAVQP